MVTGKDIELVNVLHFCKSQKYEAMCVMVRQPVQGCVTWGSSGMDSRPPPVTLSRNN